MTKIRCVERLNVSDPKEDWQKVSAVENPLHCIL